VEAIQVVCINVLNLS